MDQPESWYFSVRAVVEILIEVTRLYFGKRVAMRLECPPFPLQLRNYSSNDFHAALLCIPSLSYTSPPVWQNTPGSSGEPPREACTSTHPRPWRHHSIEEKEHARRYDRTLQEFIDTRSVRESSCPWMTAVSRTLTPASIHGRVGTRRDNSTYRRWPGFARFRREGSIKVRARTSLFRG